MCASRTITLALGLSLSGLLLPPLSAGQLPPGAAAFNIALKPVKLADADSRLDNLLKQRYNEAVREANLRLKAVEAGVTNGYEFLMDSLQRLDRAGKQLPLAGADRVKILEQHLAVIRRVEEGIAERAETLRQGGITNTGFPVMYHRIRYLRLDLEIDLLRAQPKAGAQD